MIVSTNSTAFLIAALMFAASVGANVVRPGAKVPGGEPAISMGSMIPKKFGDWEEVPQGFVQVVNPQTQELLDKLYTEIVTRVYVHSSGYRVMLSLAYGSDQRGALQAHKPEVCYPAQGFMLRTNEAGRVSTGFGDIPVRRLFATLGTRHEPVTYWFTVGDTAVKGNTQKRIVELSFVLTGRVPDGLLFRVSSIDSDAAKAFQMQDMFVSELLRSVSPAERKRLSGLRES